MKKIFAILLLVSLSLLSVGAAVMAEDGAEVPAAQSEVAATGSGSGNVYVDYTRLNMPDNYGLYAYPITIGIDYSEGFIAGGYYSIGTGYGNIWDGIDVPDGFSQNSYMAYIGYNALDTESASLGIIASYWNVNPKTDDVSMELSSLGIGVKGVVKSGPVNLSLLYSYGVSNTIKNDSDTYTDKTYVSVVELKGIYYFSDSIGMHAVYRWIPVTTDYFPGVTNFHSFGLGVDFKF